MKYPLKASFVNVARTQSTANTFRITANAIQVTAPNSQWGLANLAALDDVFQPSTSYRCQLQCTFTGHHIMCVIAEALPYPVTLLCVGTYVVKNYENFAKMYLNILESVS